MPPEVLGDEEDEQLVTYELVQGCYNTQLEKRHTRYSMPTACLLLALQVAAILDIHHAALPLHSLPLADNALTLPLVIVRNLFLPRSNPCRTQLVGRLYDERLGER